MSHPTNTDLVELIEQSFLQAIEEGNYPLAETIIQGAIDRGLDSEFTDNLKASLKRAKSLDEDKYE